MGRLSFDDKTSEALSQLQNTELSPMEEALFQAWTKANGIAKPDDPSDMTDYRGVYKATNGAVLPNGELKRISQKTNAEYQLHDLLFDKMMQRINEVKQKHREHIDAFKPKQVGKP